MIYLKEIFNGRTAPVLAAILALLIFIIQVESTKIAYKKPIQGKTNAVKEKFPKSKISEELSATTKPPAVAPLPTPSTTTAAILTSKKTSETATTTPITTTNAATTINDELDVAETTHAVKVELSKEEKPIDHVENEQVQVEPAVDRSATTTISSMEFQEVAAPNENFEENQLEQKQSGEKATAAQSQERAVVEEPLNFERDTTISTGVVESPEATTTAPTILTTAATTASTITTTTAAPTTPSNRPVPCTCGVFMTSQVKRTGNPYEAPIGRPVIINELDRTFPCNAVGQKQCQTKCLETIVQHLPNSANILCASLDHDIRKERAYLFIKNCRSQWFNTNLAAGREYCCKNGQPYQCPLV